MTILDSEQVKNGRVRSSHSRFAPCDCFSSLFSSLCHFSFELACLALFLHRCAFAVRKSCRELRECESL